MKHKELKITFRNGINKSEIIWPLVRSVTGLNYVMTELGRIALQDDSYLCRVGEIIFDANKSSFEEYIDFIHWLDFQISNRINLFVPVILVNDVEKEADKHLKTGCYKFSYIQREYCDQSNKWIEIKRKEKGLTLPKSEIQMIDNRCLVAPLWLIEKITPDCFSKTPECVRIVKKRDLLNLMHSHYNQIMGVSNSLRLSIFCKFQSIKPFMRIVSKKAN
jgi:hypothetical protein